MGAGSSAAGDSKQMANTHRVVILGGGFGGLSAAQHLKGAPVEITLIDRCNYHLFQPLLYQVATGSLSPANIASPLRNILKGQKNVRVFLAEATRIDAGNRRVILKDGEVEYDTLIVATGSSHQYFGHDEWEKFAPGLKTSTMQRTCAGASCWPLKRPSGRATLKN